MKMYKLIFALLLFTNIYAQTQFGEWKIYADMKYVSGTVSSVNGIWCTTYGGAFRLNADNNFLTINKADGMMSQSLSAVAKDNYGKIWLGSQDGYIMVYNEADGTLNNITEIGKYDRSIKKINNIFVSGDTVFISTSFGLSLINSTNFSFYDTFTKLGSFTAEKNVVSTFKQNVIYAITESGVAVQKPGTQNLSVPESWNTYSFGSTELLAASASKIVSFNGSILLATNKGVAKFSGQAWEKFLLDDADVKNLYVSNNILYLLTANQLYNYDGTQLNLVYENYSTTLNSLTVSDNNQIYIASSSGLIRLNDQTILKPEGPAGNLFLNMAVSNNGNLYAATGKDASGIGFMEFDGTNWNLYDKQQYSQIPMNDYYNVTAGSDGKIYFAIWGGGITIFNNGQLETYNSTNSPLVGVPWSTAFVAISDIELDSKGNAWIANVISGERKPLTVKTADNKWYSYAFTNPIINEDEVLGNMAIDDNNTKWFFTIAGNMGLYYFNENKTFENTSDDTQGFISADDGLLSSVLTALAVDKRGYLWIGTSVGLNLITDPSKPKSTLTSSIAFALRDQTVNCIAVDPLDKKWIGTKQGVFVLASDGFTLLEHYNKTNSPLPNNDIKSIAIDSKSGRVYIGTDDGLTVLLTESIEPVESLGDLFVYPNPFIIENNDQKITIDGLIKNTSIKIFDISGNLISSFVTPGGKVAQWDGKNMNGKFVASGIYVIVAYDDEANNVATGKVAVLRK
ncbi:MAG: T9SS type A sorting domain-containing protein [Ignavibacteriales bacterium]|nr:T9SS type A sorting domain-containing protein [Ignavibacteriales bacterium]